LNNIFNALTSSAGISRLKLAASVPKKLYINLIATFLHGNIKTLDNEIL